MTNNQQQTPMFGRAPFLRNVIQLFMLEIRIGCCGNPSGRGKNETVPAQVLQMKILVVSLMIIRWTRQLILGTNQNPVAHACV
jgi:hypothetical protein